MSNKQYVIERLTKDEMPIVVEWATRLGWNPGLHDASCFYEADPMGFFVGKLDGQIIALGAAVIYDEHFAFCGLYMVDSAWRGNGYGLALTQARLAYIGQRNAGLDGVMNMVGKYARLGYKVAYTTTRYECKQFYPDVSVNNAIFPLTHVNFDELMRYDRRHFPANRRAFLNCWISQPLTKGLGYIQDGRLCGYGVIRACQDGFKIGPLFADTPEIADALFLNLALHAQGQSINLDVPENNSDAVNLVQRYPFTKIFETQRMYLKELPAIESQHIYGITTFELG